MPKPLDDVLLRAKIEKLNKVDGEKLERATGLEPARRGGPATGIEILRATLTLRPLKTQWYFNAISMTNT